MKVSPVTLPVWLNSCFSHLKQTPSLPFADLSGWGKLLEYVGETVHIPAFPGGSLE